jgi:recombination protein RecT
LKREARVKAAIDALPGGDIDDWLPIAYSDVDERLWPVARRSLIAHVDALHRA